jgi:hypothetical protein
MLFRTLAYLLLGWILIAAVPALGYRFEITVMLPATTAVLITHLAFSREGSLPWGLAVATALGYLEDMHQGAPIGTLTLAYALTFLGLRWASARIALQGLLTWTLASVAAVVAVDLVTWATLMILAERLGILRDGLNHGLWEARWHVLATALVAYPLWLGVDRLFRALRLDRVHASEAKEGARRPPLIGR